MTETKALTLTEFLTARIDEDGAAAQAATLGPWRDMPMGSEGSVVLAGGLTVTTSRRPARCSEFSDAAHIARHDPVRVLAECEAKRQLIKRVGNPNWAGFSILALPYADHPDYRPEWRP